MPSSGADHSATPADLRRDSVELTVKPLVLATRTSPLLARVPALNVARYCASSMVRISRASGRKFTKRSRSLMITPRLHVRSVPVHAPPQPPNTEGVFARSVAVVDGSNHAVQSCVHRNDPVI